MAFTWLSKFDVVINNDNSTSALLLGTLIAKIAEKHVDSVDEIQTFIASIIGKPDGYALKSFLELVNKYMPIFNNLDETIDWLLYNAIDLWANVINDSTIKKPSF